MSRDAYRVGVVGCGWVGTNRHVPAYESDDRTEVVAVYDRSMSTAREVADEKGIPQAHDTLEAFLESDLDLVSVCTPPWTHPEIAIEVMEAGSHVLTEKPMATTIEAAEGMVETAEATGQHLGVVHNFLYARSMRKLRKIVDSGRAGAVQSVIGFQMSSPNRHLPSWYPRLPGGLFYDESPHLLYLIEHFLPEVGLDTVSAVVDGDADQPVKSLTAGLRDDDLHGSLIMMFEAPLSEWYFTVVCEEKVLVADIFRDVLLTFDAEESHSAREVLGVSVGAMAQETKGLIASGTRMVSGSLLFGMDRLVSEYVDGIESGEGPPIDGHEGKRIVELMHDVLDGIDGDV